MLDLTVLCEASPVYARLTAGMSTPERMRADIGFYVISEQTFTIRRIRIEEFSFVEEVEDFRAMVNDKKLITVVEVGNQVHAFAGSRLSREMNGKKLSLEGKESKPVKLEELSDVEYDAITRITAVAIKLLELSKTLKSKNEKTEIYEERFTYKNKSLDLSTQQVARLFLKLRSIPAKIQQYILDQWAEALEIEAQKKKEDDKRDRLKKEEKEYRDLQYRILQSEISSDELKRRERCLEVIADFFKGAE